MCDPGAPPALQFVQADGQGRYVSVARDLVGGRIERCGLEPSIQLWWNSYAGLFNRTLPGAFLTLDTYRHSLGSFGLRPEGSQYHIFGSFLVVRVDFKGSPIDLTVADVKKYKELFR